jgi:hypothetical protein
VQICGSGLDAAMASKRISSFTVPSVLITSLQLKQANSPIDGTRASFTQVAVTLLVAELLAGQA